MTGTTDFGQISASSDPSCKLAFDIFVDRILGFIGSYYIKLEGRVDALVFAGGIGEKGSSLRTKIVAKCKCLGFELDERLNGASMENILQDIGKDGARHRTLVCQTDEQVRKKCAHWHRGRGANLGIVGNGTAMRNRCDFLMVLRNCTEYQVVNLLISQLSELSSIIEVKEVSNVH